MGDWRDGGSVGVGVAAADADANKAQSARCFFARSIRHVLYPSSVSLGVHFALTAAQLKRIRAARGDDDAVLELLEEIEDAWDAEWLVQSDKAWDAMHRALADGQLTFEGGKQHAPLGLVVLGGESMVEDDDETVVLLEPSSVAAAAQAMTKLTEECFRERYFRLCPGYAPEFGDEDFDYTWSHLRSVRDFFAKAAKAKRSIVFTASS